MFLKWRDEVTARVHVFKTAQYYICLNINTSSSRLILFPLIHFLSLVSFDAWFEPDKKCDDFDGVHIILLLGICNLLVFSRPSSQFISTQPMGADLDLALDQWELRDRSRDAALEAGSVVLWEASMLHALHLPKNVLADHHQKEEKKSSKRRQDFENLFSIVRPNNSESLEWQKLRVFCINQNFTNFLVKHRKN